MVLGLADQSCGGGAPRLHHLLLCRRLYGVAEAATPQNIVIGGAAGALPPVVGWAAATGGVSIESSSCSLIIFMWTPPHFWALACSSRDDYARAGVPDDACRRRSGCDPAADPALQPRPRAGRRAAHPHGLRAALRRRRRHRRRRHVGLAVASSACARTDEPQGPKRLFAYLDPLSLPALRDAARSRQWSRGWRWGPDAVADRRARCWPHPGAGAGGGRSAISPSPSPWLLLRGAVLRRDAHQAAPASLSQG